jgi:arsenical-resistance protein 2
MCDATVKNQSDANNIARGARWILNQGTATFLRIFVLSSAIMEDKMATKAEAPWYDGYPAVKSQDVSVLVRSDFLRMIHSGASPGQDFLLVDLRRNDHVVCNACICASIPLTNDLHQGGTIHGSLNLPAQSLYPSLPTLYAIVKAAKIPRVIWYCGKSSLTYTVQFANPLMSSKGSSRGRGNRAAGWFQDLLTEKEDHDIASLVLVEGIAGWVKGGAEYTKLIDEYDPEAWHKD